MQRVPPSWRAVWCYIVAVTQCLERPLISITTFVNAWRVLPSRGAGHQPTVSFQAP